MSTMPRTNANPDGDPNGALDVWLQITSMEYDDEPGELYDEVTAEANTYRDDDSYRIEWYLSAVGLVTRVYFNTYEECTAWYERENFQDFSS